MWQVGKGVLEDINKEDSHKTPSKNTKCIYIFDIKCNPFSSSMLVQEETQGKATLHCGYVVALTHPGTQTKLCVLTHSLDEKSILLKTLISD